MKGNVLAIFASWFLITSSVWATEFDEITIRVNDKTLNLEFAHTFEQRAKGLMNRKNLCQHCGMLFRYSSSKIASMWMKNTLIPLDVAFIDRNGIIVAIRAMQPHDLTSIAAPSPVLYALEMNQGWFRENQVNVGDMVIIGQTSINR